MSPIQSTLPAVSCLLANAPERAKPANGSSGSTNSPKPSASQKHSPPPTTADQSPGTKRPENGPTPDAQRTRDEQRTRAIERLLALFHLAYDREPPTGAERTAKVAVWSQALADIPTAQIPVLAGLELRERTSPFFPVPADIIRRWHNHRPPHLTPEGAANSAAYLPYNPPPVPQLVPSTETMPALQIAPTELKRHLQLPPPRPTMLHPRKASPPLPPQAKPTAFSSAPPLERSSPPLECKTPLPLKSETYLDSLAHSANIALDQCTPAQLDALRAFAHWWHAHHPHRVLRPDEFAPTYQQFQLDKSDNSNEVKKQASQAELPQEAIS